MSEVECEIHNGEFVLGISSADHRALIWMSNGVAQGFAITANHLAFGTSSPEEIDRIGSHEALEKVDPMRTSPVVLQRHDREVLATGIGQQELHCLSR